MITDGESSKSWSAPLSSSCRGIMSEAKIRSLRKDALRREQNSLDERIAHDARVERMLLDRILGG